MKLACRCVGICLELHVSELLGLFELGADDLAGCDADTVSPSEACRWPP